MEKNNPAGNNKTRRRLVIPRWLCTLFIGLSLLSGCSNSLNQTGSAQVPGNYILKSATEILNFRAGYLYGKYLYYLLFLPGPCCLLTVLLARKRRLPKIAASLLLFTAFSFIKAQPGPRELLEQGARAYWLGAVEESLAAFRQAGEYLPLNAPLQYNIAVCYYKLGKPGYAVDNLKQAVGIDCRDKTITGFLESIAASEQLFSQVDTKPYLHPDIPFIVILVCFNLSFLLLILLFYIKKGQLIILFICFVVFTFLALGVFIANQVHMGQQTGVIANGPAPVKQIPDERGKARITLRAGTIVKVLWQREDNVFIRTGRGFKGWVKQDKILTD